jgi:hypothetical protein
MRDQIGYRIVAIVKESWARRPDKYLMQRWAKEIAQIRSTQTFVPIVLGPEAPHPNPPGEMYYENLREEADFQRRFDAGEFN